MLFAEPERGRSEPSRLGHPNLGLGAAEVRCGSALTAKVQPMTPPGCQVLIVEDDPELRHMMVQMLLEEGFEPESAGDGLEALADAAGTWTSPAC